MASGGRNKRLAVTENKGWQWQKTKAGSERKEGL